MALTWDATACVDTNAIGIGDDAPEREWHITETVIFATLLTGLGKEHRITEANHKEIFERMSALEHALDNPIRYREGEQVETRWLTLADIQRRIGLRTNASSVTRAAFERKLGQILLQAAQRR